MKQALTAVLDDRISEEALAGVYFRDIFVLRGLDPLDEGIFEATLENLPTAEEVRTIIDKREQQSLYKGFHLFEMGDGKIIQSLRPIREALLAEEGLVADDDLETFREQI